jgi:REP element-mobilizing transposase RayT
MTSWLVSSTFYGQWLPGDPRGSVTNIRERRYSDHTSPVRHEHDRPGEEYEHEMPQLQAAARSQLKCAPISLNLAQAEQLLEQFLETAEHRGWILDAVSIMFNHFHLVVQAPSEFGKKKLLRDFKSYGSRRLTRISGRPASDTWWTESGSCRPVRNQLAAIYYVCHRQPKPLVVWSRERGRISPEESDPRNRYPGDDVLDSEPYED